MTEKRLTIKNKGLIHRGAPTPRIGTKSKRYPIKQNKHEKMQKPEQGNAGKINDKPCATPKKIPVKASDKDVRAVGARSGDNAKLFAKFAESKHLKVNGGGAGGGSRSAGPNRTASRSGGSRRSRAPRSVNTTTEVGAVTAALSEMLGAGPAPRPGFGQQPFTGRDQRGVGGVRDQNVRRTRTVR